VEPSGLEPLTPACHAVAKKTAKISKNFIYDIFLIKPSAEISAVLSKQE
tara:strand:- start:366 stop:512 length:147 start_codon:yes stop_codon:yes gene_type:complete